MNWDLPVLTPRMQRVMDRAEQLAYERGMNVIGTEHVMLALLDDPRAIATTALGRVADLSRVRDEILGIIDSDGYKGRAHP